MAATYWHKQEPGKPLYPDLLWSKPENKLHAGKLFIIGGNAHGFASPATAYQESLKAGVGVVKVLLPDALQKIVGKHFEAAEFAASTPSGSFSRPSLDAMLAGAHWADATLLAGELGRNSETAIVLESFLAKVPSQLTLTRDAVDYFYHISEKLLTRPDTLLVITMAQLQKLCIAAKFPRAITFSMDLLNLIDTLHEFTKKYPIHIIVKHLGIVIVAIRGQVSTTNLTEDQEIWRVTTATHAAVWWLQHNNSPFKALTTSVVHID